MSQQEFDRRASIITRMSKEGAPLNDIANATGISSSAVCQFIKRYMSGGVFVRKDRTDSGRRDLVSEQAWQVGDPSTLSQEVIEDCYRLGIKPKRMAWLLSCPRGGHKFAKLREDGIL